MPAFCRVFSAPAVEGFARFPSLSVDVATGYGECPLLAPVEKLSCPGVGPDRSVDVVGVPNAHLPDNPVAAGEPPRLDRRVVRPPRRQHERIGTVFDDSTGVG